MAETYLTITPSPSNCLAASKVIWTDLECATMVIWLPKAQSERENEKKCSERTWYAMFHISCHHNMLRYLGCSFNDCWTAFVVHIQMSLHFNMATSNGSLFCTGGQFIYSLLQSLYNGNLFTIRTATKARSILPANKWVTKFVNNTINVTLLQPENKNKNKCHITTLNSP